MDYSILKSGTDIRGVATDKGGNIVTLTPIVIYEITAAFVEWVINKYGGDKTRIKIAVGHDSRITSEDISEIVKQAIIKSGINVVDCGLSSTPAMFMTTVDLGVVAAIEVTASHHPFDRNGLKFFTRDGGLDGVDIDEIILLANNVYVRRTDFTGYITKVNYMQDYAARLRRLICDAVGKSETELPLRGYKIVVDAGNGVGGFYVKEVLQKLGADITGSRFLEPDGMFPNHIPNPENEEAMHSICDAVKQNNADLGIIFDTDVDRAGCVGSDGKEINRNRLIASASYIATRNENDAIIVTDSITSDGLKEYIESELRCKHYRYRRGYKNVIDKAIEFTLQGLNCPLAIETSGHAAFKENFFLDDGAYLVTKVVIELAKGNNINDILKQLKLPCEEKEIRIEIIAEDFKSYGDKVLKDFEEYVSKISEYRIADDNREGIRVSTPNGWFLLRLSVHDPVIVLNLESNINGGNEIVYLILKSFFAQFEALILPELLKI